MRVRHYYGLTPYLGLHSPPLARPPDAAEMCVAGCCWSSEDSNDLIDQQIPVEHTIMWARNSRRRQCGGVSTTTSPAFTSIGMNPASNKPSQGAGHLYWYYSVRQAHEFLWLWEWELLSTHYWLFVPACVSTTVSACRHVLREASTV